MGAEPGPFFKPRTSKASLGPAAGAALELSPRAAIPSEPPNAAPPERGSLATVPDAGTRRHNTRVQRHARRSLASLVALGVLTACTQPRVVELSLGTWWQSDSERFAFKELRDSFTATHPNVSFDSKTDTNVRTRNYVAQGLVHGAPPDTFQANFGRDLLRWVNPTFDAPELDPAEREPGSLLEDVSDLVPPGVVPDELRDNLMFAGRVYGVPIDIHRVNMLYCNQSRVTPDALTIERLCPEPGSDDEPEVNVPERIRCDQDAANGGNADCSTLASGDPAAPILAIGSCQPWIVQNLAFEALLPALLGADDYNALFRPGPELATITGLASFEARFKDKLKRVLHCVRHLKRHVRICETQNWWHAAAAVMHGKADFTLAGDWAQGEFRDAPDVAALAMPQDLFLFTSDVFPLPKHAAHPEEARDLLSMIMSADLQRRFSQWKGSIPALSNVVADSSRAKLTDFAPERRLTATSGLISIDYPAEVSLRLTDLLLRSQEDDEREDDDAVRAIATGFGVLQKWQRQLRGQ